MTHRDDTRSCPRCELLLSGREHFGETGLTVIWQCSCGWASARTVSRDPVRDARRRVASESKVDVVPVPVEGPALTPPHKQREGDG